MGSPRLSQQTQGQPSTSGSSQGRGGHPIRPERGASVGRLGTGNLGPSVPARLPFREPIERVRISTAAADGLIFRTCNYRPIKRSRSPAHKMNGTFRPNRGQPQCLGRSRPWQWPPIRPTLPFRPSRQGSPMATLPFGPTLPGPKIPGLPFRVLRPKPFTIQSPNPVGLCSTEGKLFRRTNPWERGMNLSGSRQQGHSAAHNTLSRLSRLQRIHPRARLK